MVFTFSVKKPQLFFQRKPIMYYIIANNDIYIYIYNQLRNKNIFLLTMGILQNSNPYPFPFLHDIVFVPSQDVASITQEIFCKLLINVMKKHKAFLKSKFENITSNHKQPLFKANDAKIRGPRGLKMFYWNKWQNFKMRQIISFINVNMCIKTSNI